MYNLKLTSYIYLVLTWLTATTLSDPIIVNTKNGPVQGLKSLTVENNATYYSFRGIPFAEPPVGNLRFAAPRPASNWDGTWDATEEGNHCIQGSNPVNGLEDCLFINVYTPAINSHTCKPRATVVWIYGGGFEGGDSTYQLYGPDHILEQDVVLVSFNYRLGVFGFISTGDEVVPGNNGLKDQNLALKWVQDNIRSFCGNPDKVTIAGQSAGSASVAYHIQSKQSRGLFHQAILESGVSLSLWAMSRKAPQVAYSIGSQLGVDISSSQALVDGLRGVNASFLQETSAGVASSALVDNPRAGFIFAPVSEPEHPDAFFTGKSYEILERGDVAKVPILIGYNSLEGSFNLKGSLQIVLALFDLDNKRLLPIDLNINPLLADTAAKRIKDFYFRWLPIALSPTAFCKFISDDQFVRPIREFSRLMKNHVKEVYEYRFSYEGGLWGNYNRTTAGVTHSEELGYLFRSYHSPKNDEDLLVRQRFVTLWTNFVKHGNPTPVQEPVLQNQIWKSVENKPAVMDIGVNMVLTEDPGKKAFDFWTSFYQQFGNSPYDTY